MKKYIRLLIEGLFDDIYDLNNDTNDVIELGDDIIYDNTISELKKLKNNITDYSDITRNNVLDFKKYILIADKIYTFINKAYSYLNLKYKVEKAHDDLYKICICSAVASHLSICNFYIHDDIIENIEINVSLFITYSGKTVKIGIIELLTLLKSLNISVKEITLNTYSTAPSFTRIIFHKIIYTKDYVLTSDIIDNFPEINIQKGLNNKHNIFNESNLTAEICGIIFDNEDTCNKFYEYLKQKNIKKYDCKSYGYIINGEQFANILKIQTDFCIKNKFVQYTFTSNKSQILDILEDETVNYCKKHYKFIDDGYSWSYGFKDKGKDKNGSFIQIDISFEFDDIDNKHQYYTFIWKFYKTGQFELLENKKGGYFYKI